MVTVKINISAYVAEYIAGKFWDEAAGAVRFPADSDIYILLYDLLQKRPADSPVDRGNLELALPCRREGKKPETYNYLSARAQAMLEEKMRTMMWAEAHEYLDSQKHVKGVDFKDSIFTFMCRYGIESISEDAIFKNYQRWRYKVRRREKRAYARKKR